MPFSQHYRGSSNPNDKELLREKKNSLAIDWIKLSSNPKAIEILLENPNSLAID
jgi:hypothetical protein